MELFKKKGTIEIDAQELREMQRKINILEHDYDVLNQEMTEVVKKLARVERKAYRNDKELSLLPEESPKQGIQTGFWVPNK